MLYRLLKIIVGVGIRLFYRQIRVIGREHLETRGPKIILANHPNTLMDAWMIGHICNQRIYYMAKGTFFNTRFKRWVLGSLGMIPVNRKSDAKIDGVSNLDSFEACYRLLEEGKTLVIFPEGNSYKERLLRKLKSGSARIALQTEVRNNKQLGLQIIPIGLNYTEPEKFRSSVLANIGAPIDPKPYVDLFQSDSLKAARKLTEEIRIGMTRLLVNSESKEEEKLVEGIVDLLSSEYIKTPEKGVERDVKEMREVFAQMNAIRVSQPWKIREIALLVESLKIRIEHLHIKSDFLDRKYRTSLFVRQLVSSFFVMLIGFPLFVFGMVHNFVQYKLVDFLVVKMVNDVEYHAPVSVLFSLVLYPLVYTSFLIGLGPWLEGHFWWKVAYFFSMPLSGLFAYYYVKYYRHISFKRKYIFLMRKRKSDVETLKQERESLRKLVFEQ
ncbi:MAG: lysophospholipid acyltransferase family protein [bacterium]|nr:lysophospholipid acyltransferase family protein [bacterium]